MLEIYTASVRELSELADLHGLDLNLTIEYGARLINPIVSLQLTDGKSTAEIQLLRPFGMKEFEAAIEAVKDNTRRVERVLHDERCKDFCENDRARGERPD